MSDQRARNRVKSLKVDEVSLVDRPANSAARFVLAKRDEIQKDEDDLDALEAELNELEDEINAIEAGGSDEDEDDVSDELDELEAEIESLDAEIVAELDIDEGDEEGVDDDEELDYDEDESDDLDEDDDIEDELDEESISQYEAEHEDEDMEVLVGKGAGAQTALGSMMEALRESIDSIVNDDDADEPVKKSAMATTIGQFQKEAERLLGEAGAVSKSIKGEGVSTINKQVEERLTKLHDENIELRKNLDTLTEERADEKRQTEARAVLGKGASDKDIKALADLLKSAAPEQVEFVKSLASRSAKLAKSAALFDEIGTSTSNGGSTSSAVETMVSDLQKANPAMTRPQAIAKAYESLGDEAYLDAQDEA